ncbi:MAG: HDIG domain-containing protein [Candidatus Hydrogenedentota bacterium]
MIDFFRRRSKPGNGFSLGPVESSPSLAHRKQRLQNLFTLLVLALLVASVTDIPILNDSSNQPDIESQSIASQSVVAAFAFQSENLDATREKRELAAVGVPNTWHINTERVASQLENLQLRITTLSGRTDEVREAIVAALAQSAANQSLEAIVDAVLLELATEWKEGPLSNGFPEIAEITAWIQPNFSTLPNRFYEEDTEENAGNTNRAVIRLEPADGSEIEFSNLIPLTDLSHQALEYLLNTGIKQQGSMTGSENENAPDYIIIERERANIVGDLKVYDERPIKEVPDTLSARVLLLTKVRDLSKELQNDYEETFSNWERLQVAASELAKLSITDTLSYNRVRTESAREKVRQKTPPVMTKIEANQMLQEENYQWTRQSRHDVHEYWRLTSGLAQKPGSLFVPLFSNLIIVSLILLGMYRAVAVLESPHTNAFKSINIMMLIIVATVVLGRILWFFELTGFLIPVTASAVLLTILTNARLAAIASIVISIMLSIQFSQDWRLLVVTGTMSFTGIMSIYRVRKRRDITSAIIKATVLGGVVVLATTLSLDAPIDSTFEFLALVTINGLICSFLVPGLLSPLERLFAVTTDIQLLEYSDLNNEILNKLAIKVPATYAHSLMMGQLAETACDAIGANGLLARVCAYYHDIGKLRRPEYFSENQTGYNVHDDMSPRLSARAIASHVTEGVELAREYHLPQPIIRGILEHHGTMLISFFYQQALDQQKHGDVREEDFRYPGPKPQSRETAILMICDGVESGVRTIKSPNEDRVRDFIDKIIQGRSADRQFDECDLTLKQLDTIRDVLTSVVLSTHHSRVSYPERPSLEEAPNVIHISTGGHRR